ncbi:hypothetical protein HYH03_009322 [Edaphochlamys debaryana]|uniref:Uncharacterized protein n=1 Tax=Edaphochlamys debaryana TaxID=47281 RepID=A0A835XZ34_9CHLO|nr:hypothetical protein HYH03_009322 [Edaphochlamys debaryana]|eukprot:KAG2492374.1 hypothetical protein HYH03_009322 [Edaphochlamys debaryana]
MPHPHPVPLAAGATALLALCCCVVAASAGACPPAGFTAVSPLNLKQFIAAPWYVQKQLPLSYQPPNTLFCVKARLGRGRAGLTVNNYANVGKVNGASMGSSKYDSSKSSFGKLIALPATSGGDGSDGRLKVGPEPLLRLPAAARNAAFGPYWVVAVGPSANQTIGYDWAIISGGPPTFEGPNGTCTTLRGGVLGRTERQLNPVESGGLWFFSRTPVDPAATAVMEQKAAALGLDTSKLLPVQQDGCKYEFPA